MPGRNHSRYGRNASWAKLVIGETPGYPTYVHCMWPQSFLDVVYITMTLIKALRKMASNQTNRFQSLDLSVEEFIDGQENENTKKKT